MLIATHDGTFHADETTACAILTYLYPNSSVIRSRDPQELEQADIILDVSGINDAKHFDHHSKDFTAARPNGIAYATAGLMWDKFGRQFLEHIAAQYQLDVSAQIIESARRRIDKEMMELIDLNDNGQLTSYLTAKCQPRTAGETAIFNELNEFYQHDPNIPYIVAMQNLPAAGPAEQQKAFLSTVKMLRSILISTAVNALTTETGIAKVLALYDGGPLLIMHEKLPWSAAVLDNLEHFKACSLAIYPDRKRGWRVQSLPVSAGERFKNRVTAPENWRGLDFAALDAACGLNGTIFVHKSGFTGGALEFDTTVQMAKLWLEQGVWDPRFAPQQA